MKNGKCPKCNSTSVYFKPCALDKITLDGKGVEYTDYVRAKKLGDWQKAK